jgi:hypothetical protein
MKYGNMLINGVFYALEMEYLYVVCHQDVVCHIYSKDLITEENFVLEMHNFKVSYQGEDAAKINDVVPGVSGTTPPSSPVCWTFYRTPSESSSSST